MKTIFASALVAASLFSAQAFASPETTHNGIPVMSTKGVQPVPYSAAANQFSLVQGTASVPSQVEIRESASK